MGKDYYGFYTKVTFLPIRTADIGSLGVLKLSLKKMERHCGTLSQTGNQRKEEMQFTSVVTQMEIVEIFT